MNHKTAPLDVRDRAAVSVDNLERELNRLMESDSLLECVLISSCNRIEIYAVTDELDSALQHCSAYFQERSGASADDLHEYLYCFRGREAFEHLFDVISGLDSMALGEAQIAGQVREAYNIAHRSDNTGVLTNRLFDQAFHLNKWVRTETGIGEGSISVSHLAVDLAVQIFGDLRSREVLVLGAGKMSELTMQHLLGHGASTICIANRTAERAKKLAAQFGQHSIPWENFPERLKTAEIVLSSTAAPEPIIQKSEMEAIMKERDNKPLFIIDIAVPKDVEPEVADLYNVYLYNVDDLQHVVQDNLSRRQHEIEHARRIIQQELNNFESWLQSRDASEVIVDLRAHYDDIRKAELEWLKPKMNDIDEKQWKAIVAFSNRLMNKYLHQPTSTLRDAQPDEHRHSQFVEFVRHLFNLKK